MTKSSKNNLILVILLSIIIGISFGIKRYIKSELFINSFNIINLALIVIY